MAKFKRARARKRRAGQSGFALVRRAGGFVRRKARRPQKVEMVTLGASAAVGAGLGYWANQPKGIPEYMGVPAEAIAGVLAAVAGTMVPALARGAIGEVARGAAGGALACAGYRYARNNGWGADKANAVAGDYIVGEDDTEYTDE